MKRFKLFLMLIILLFTAVSCDINFVIGTSSTITNESTEATKTITSTEEAEYRTLSLLTMNDTHGYIKQNEYGKKGISNLSYLINNVREAAGEDNVLLVANGDMFQGTGLVRMSYGKVMIDVMNEMGFDACCIGNHEFDWDLPKILEYFDGIEENGEADFPLLNANVYDEYKELIASDDKICPYKVFDKAGVKVAVIGYIGNVKSSINALYADSYTFNTNIADDVYKTAAKIKHYDIADIVIVSIHDGDSSGVEYYNINKQLANLKYDGEYLVDGVINGHTHTHQFGSIARANGIAMPIIQTSGYSNGYISEAGRIDFTIDVTNKCVADYYISYLNVNDAGANFDSNVEEIIDNYYDESEEELSKVYCINDTFINRYSSNTYEYVSNVMLNATGADFVLCNTGGLRANIPAGNVGFEELYMVNPFDNEIIIHECSASKIEDFLNNNIGYYFYGYADSYSDTLKVAVIDYVFFSSYYRSCYTDDYFNTHIILRDLLIEDMSMRSHIDLSKDTSALIERIID